MRHDRRRAALAAVALLAVVPMVACSSGGSTGPVPPKPALVTIVAREYRFDYSPPRKRGRTVFELRNRGRRNHDMVLVELPADVPPIDVQLRSPSRQVVPTLASLPARRPGGRGTFALDLAAGRYAIICFVRDPDGRQHAQKGMSSEFRIR
jgi:hypothetical protein